MMNKKGSLLDIIFAGVVLLAIFVTGLFAFVLQDNLSDAGLYDFNNDTKEVQSITNTNMNIIDGTIVFIWFISMIAAGILAYLLRSSPIFIVIAIIIVVILIVVSVIMANLHHELIQQDEFASIASSHLALSSWIIGRLPVWTLVFSAIMMVIIYALGDT